MKSYIRDPFQVRRLEKLLRRPLTEMELEGQVPVKYQETSGKVIVEWIRKFNFRDFYGQ